MPVTAPTKAGKVTETKGCKALRLEEPLYVHHKDGVVGEGTRAEIQCTQLKKASGIGDGSGSFTPG